MSRLGKKPVLLPKDVTLQVDGSLLVVKGPRGELKRKIPSDISVSRADGQVSVQLNRGAHGSLQGSFRKLIENMVVGVTQGFKCALQIEGVGYRAQVTGNKISMQLGFSKPYEYIVPAGIKVAIDQKQTNIALEGNDKELVGLVAAQIRSVKKPEPYKGTGIRYQGEQIKRKAGKAAAGAAAGGASGAKK